MLSKKKQNLLVAVFFLLSVLFTFQTLEAVEMALIPAGTYIVGTDDPEADDPVNGPGPVQGIYLADSTPARHVSQDAFYIDVFEVSNVDYQLFCKETGHPVPQNWVDGIAKGEEKRPVVNVTWFNANSYCKWAKKRLPTEEEWEIAARGSQGNIFPWGNSFDAQLANLTLGKPVPGGTIPTDKSPFGVFDMAGNVTEWTSSWYTQKPGNTVPSELYGKKFRVLRGGEGVTLKQHYKTSGVLFRSYVRNFSLPASRGPDAGFRCVRSVK
ncbi:MAG: formylglycine-generating enzyme family protein [Nitrospinota bacterium]